MDCSMIGLASVGHVILAQAVPIYCSQLAEA